MVIFHSYVNIYQRVYYVGYNDVDIMSYGVYNCSFRPILI